jgi:hypothetical protein
LGIDVRTGDGRVYPLNLQAAAAFRPFAAATATGLAGRWVPAIESWNEALNRGGSALPVTEAGRVARAAANAAPEALCGRLAPLQMMLLPELRTIEVGEAAIVMSFEAEGLHQRRVVHIGAEHPADVEPSLLGHSIGRWEGETLLIDTVAIAPQRRGGFWVPSTETTHLVERLKLTADRQRLEYTFTVEDPAYLTNPISYTSIWDHRPDLEPSSVEPCDPDNARRALVE